MSWGSRRLPRCTNRRARAARSRVLLARSSPASGASALAEWTERFGSCLRKRPLGFDVENADDRASAPQRNRELGEDARQGCDVVRIRGDVRRELRTTEPDRSTGDPMLDGDPVGNDGVAALRDEPQPSVLEDEDGRHDAGDRVVEAVDRGLDRARGLGAVADRARGLARRGREERDVDGAHDTCSRSGTVHVPNIGVPSAVLETRPGVTAGRDPGTSRGSRRPRTGRSRRRARGTARAGSTACAPPCRAARTGRRQGRTRRRTRRTSRR